MVETNVAAQRSKVEALQQERAAIRNEIQSAEAAAVQAEATWRREGGDTRRREFEAARNRFRDLTDKEKRVLAKIGSARRTIKAEQAKQDVREERIIKRERQAKKLNALSDPQEVRDRMRAARMPITTKTVKIATLNGKSTRASPGFAAKFARTDFNDPTSTGVPGTIKPQPSGQFVGVGTRQITPQFADQFDDTLLANIKTPFAANPDLDVFSPEVKQATIKQEEREVRTAERFEAAASNLESKQATGSFRKGKKVFLPSIKNVERREAASEFAVSLNPLLALETLRNVATGSVVKARQTIQNPRVAADLFVTKRAQQIENLQKAYNLQTTKGRTAAVLDVATGVVLIKGAKGFRRTNKTPTTVIVESTDTLTGTPTVKTGSNWKPAVKQGAKPLDYIDIEVTQNQKGKVVDLREEKTFRESGVEQRRTIIGEAGEIFVVGPEFDFAKRQKAKAKRSTTQSPENIIKNLEEIRVETVKTQQEKAKKLIADLGDVKISKTPESAFKVDKKGQLQILKPPKQKTKTKKASKVDQRRIAQIEEIATPKTISAFITESKTQRLITPVSISKQTQPAAQVSRQLFGQPTTIQQAPASAIASLGAQDTFSRQVFKTSQGSKAAQKVLGATAIAEAGALLGTGLTKWFKKTRAGRPDIDLPLGGGSFSFKQPKSIRMKDVGGFATSVTAIQFGLKGSKKQLDQVFTGFEVRGKI